MPLPSLTAPPVAGPPRRLIDPKDVFVPKADDAWDWLYTVIPELADEFAPALIAAAAVATPYGQSATSLTLSAGTKAGIAAGEGKTVILGAPIRFASAADPANDWMDGVVTDYDFASGVMDVLIDNVGPSASGMHTDWFWAITGARGAIGATGETLPSKTGNAGKVLAVNSGETAAEWVGRGWELIGTLSPAAVTTAAFTSIPAIYQDILMDVSVTRASSAPVQVEISPDGSTWSGNGSFISGTGTSLINGAVLIPRYTADQGAVFHGVTVNGTSSPRLDLSPNAAYGYSCDGGISAIRASIQSGSITGTINLYGRL